MADAASQAFCFLAGVRTPACAKSGFEATGLIVTQTGPHQRRPDGIIYDISRGGKAALIFLVFVGRGAAKSSWPFGSSYAILADAASHALCFLVGARAPAQREGGRERAREGRRGSVHPHDPPKRKRSTHSLGRVLYERQFHRVPPVNAKAWRKAVGGVANLCNPSGDWS